MQSADMIYSTLSKRFYTERNTSLKYAEYAYA